MELVVIVILAALIEYMVFGALVARARVQHKVAAPAITGPVEFERTFRVHQNTLEALVVFVPAVWLFGAFVSPLWAAGIGLVFVVGRIWYAIGYIADAAKRGPGALMSGIPNMILIVGALIGAIVALV